MPRAKKAGPEAASPTAVDSAVGEAGKKAGVAMPLAPRAGTSGKEKARAVPGESPSPRGDRSRFSGKPNAQEIPQVGAWQGAGAEVEALAGSAAAAPAAAG